MSKFDLMRLPNLQQVRQMFLLQLTEPGRSHGKHAKKTKLYSRFLQLRIYPDSPVHTSANTERIHICLVMLLV